MSEKFEALRDGMQYSTVLNVIESGFYGVDFMYSHCDWDQWIAVEIKGENGETLEYMPTLIGKRQKNTVTMYLFRGKNTVTVTHLFGHELKIYDVRVSDNKPCLKPAVTPSEDYFFIDRGEKIRILLLSYSGEPMVIKAGNTEIGFAVKTCDFDDSEDKFCSGDSLIRRYIYIDRAELLKLGTGRHNLRIILPCGQELEYVLNIRETETDSQMTIVSFDVGHGNASLIRLPNGKNLMIDSGYGPRSRGVILPYLEGGGLQVDYYLLTHFHSDHDGIIDELKARYPDMSYLDSTMLRRYDRLDNMWDLGGAEITVLNSRFDENGQPLDIQNDPDIVYNEYNYENSTSVSLLVRYNGFGYYHGADNYSYAQQKNLDDFKRQGREDELKCQYFYANHHFHNDLNADFLRTVNPVAIYIPANQAVYSRSTYSVVFRNGFVDCDFPEKRFRDAFISHETGTVTVKINSGVDWYYYTE